MAEMNEKSEVSEQEIQFTIARAEVDAVFEALATVLDTRAAEVLGDRAASAKFATIAAAALVRLVANIPGILCQPENLANVEKCFTPDDEAPERMSIAFIHMFPEYVARVTAEADTAQAAEAQDGTPA